MSSKPNEEPSYSTKEINKEIDSYFKYLVNEHTDLQSAMYNIEYRCYSGGKIDINILKTKIINNIERRQLILELMWFLSQARNFEGGRAKHLEYIYGELEDELDDGLFKVLEEKYNNLNCSEYFIVNDLAKKMEKLEVPTHWLWKILYLLQKNKNVDLPRQNQECKTTEEIPADIKTMKSMHENLQKLIYQTRLQQENHIQDMDKIKKALEKFII